MNNLAYFNYFFQQKVKENPICRNQMLLELRPANDRVVGRRPHLELLLPLLH